ncbi:hypothetical protein [Neptuniibacter caesariensis]|uniref:PEP-CTERM sorting domain-containing protein n=1 Tax=Neptuniibacter caesariensis TaxID=207954 RepID=A0A7U8GR74_NEPCE|nr:hypothetical protein [Neptuniibacter caesariensis]EAR59938.1 hypothetical protein MED92_16045 [Oceanospirillum sp. MED92] [Neptuniibacter caesariensis]
MFSKVKQVLVGALLTCAAVGVNAAAVSIGDVSTIGGDYVVSSGYSPSAVTGVSQADLENFAGVLPGYLDSASGLDVVEGSAIKYTADVKAGQSITFDWIWESDEPAAGITYNDFAFVSLSQSGLITPLLATVLNDGALSTGSFSWTAIADGFVTYVIGVVDVNDDVVGSKLTVSNLSPVPVPAAALLFGSALLGFAGFSARRKVS